jgi:hypothetical protein
MNGREKSGPASYDEMINLQVTVRCEPNRAERKAPVEEKGRLRERMAKPFERGLGDGIRHGDVGRFMAGVSLREKTSDEMISDAFRAE